MINNELTQCYFSCPLTITLEINALKLINRLFTFHTYLNNFHKLLFNVLNRGGDFLLGVSQTLGQPACLGLNGFQVDPRTDTELYSDLKKERLIHSVVIYPAQ